MSRGNPLPGAHWSSPTYRLAAMWLSAPANHRHRHQVPQRGAGPCRENRRRRLLLRNSEGDGRGRNSRHRSHRAHSPQSEHALGGYRVEGRSHDAQRLIEDALALEEAGAFCVLMEMVPADTAGRVDAAIYPHNRHRRWQSDHRTGSVAGYGRDSRWESC